MSEGEWIELGAAADVSEGSSRGYAHNGRRICVVRTADAFFALDDLCTHGHAFLSEGYCDVDEGIVECPLHGGAFCFRNGAPAGSPAERPAPTFPIKVQEGVLLVFLPSPAAA